MRKRNCRVEIYFTKEELETLTKKYRKAGLSREKYCRQILNESVVKEAPSLDVHLLIRELTRVGSNINQIAAKANSLGFVDVPLLKEELEKLDKVEQIIVDSYTMDTN